MTVQALRRLARMRTNLAIGGRDIARADKNTLIQNSFISYIYSILQLFKIQLKLVTHMS